MPHGRVLGVDRHDLAAARGPGFGDDRPRRDQAFLVREREPFAGCEGGEGGGQAREPDDGIEDDIRLRQPGELGELFVGRAGTNAVGRHAERRRLFGEECGIAARRERDHVEVVAVSLDDVERLSADRAGRSENGDAARHGHQPRCGPARRLRRDGEVQ